MSRRTIDKIYFERATLVICGYGDASSVCFEGSGGLVFEPNERLQSGDRFELRFDVISGRGGPLESGEWLLDADVDCDLPTKDYSCNGTEYRIELSARDGGLCLHSHFCPARPSVKGVLVSMLLNAIFYLCRPFRPRKRPRILFSSESRSILSGNLLYVYEELKKRPEALGYKLTTCFCRRLNMLDYVKCTALLAGSEILAIDDYYPLVYQLRLPKSLKVFQLWHACGNYKTVGYSRAGKAGCPRIEGKAHRCYTHTIVSSEQVRRSYSEAFGVPIGSIYATGMPRTDMFYREDARERAAAELEGMFGDLGGKRIILFAPTFRGDGAGSAYYPYELLDLERLHDMCVVTNSVFIFKMHPFIKDAPPIPDRLRDRLLDGSDIREINDILAASDVVITDYSSVIYEAALLEKPMLYYTFDLDDYINDRDFYKPFENYLAGERCDTFDELLERLNGTPDNQKAIAFKRQNFAFDDGKSTERVADLMLK